MTRLKDIVLGAKFDLPGGGSYRFVENFPARYIADLTDRPKLRRSAQGGGGVRQRHRGRILAAGTGSDRLRGGAARLHPRPFVPALYLNSEDLAMLRANRDAVVASGAEVCLGFDGDGDRCGVVDDEGEEIFADKVGVMLARDMSSCSPRRSSSST